MTGVIEFLYKISLIMKDKVYLKKVGLGILGCELLTYCSYPRPTRLICYTYHLNQRHVLWIMEETTTSQSKCRTAKKCHQQKSVREIHLRLSSSQYHKHLMQFLCLLTWINLFIGGRRRFKKQGQWNCIGRRRFKKQGQVKGWHCG